MDPPISLLLMSEDPAVTGSRQGVYSDRIVGAGSVLWTLVVGGGAGPGGAGMQVRGQDSERVVTEITTPSLPAVRLPCPHTVIRMATQAQ